MITIQRRAVLGAAAASIVPFETWLVTEARAAGPAAVRYNVASAQGQAMLKKYAKAVGLMMAAPPGSPCSWTFQWYTHFVPNNTTKAQAIAAIYPNGQPVADKALAQAMWNTCEAHSAGMDENMFMPWHRMFVWYFENIVRKVLADPTFTLPYWNYSNPAQRQLPAAFRVVPTPAQPNPLYRSTRNAAANNGTGIPGNQVALTALAQTQYGSGPNNIPQGFNAAVDFGIHGNVHVWVGNSQGMASVPWAANDPIFWLHHCNIDRLWASWNNAGRANPGAPWTQKTFVFADANCKQIVTAVGSVDRIAKLNYTYQAFEPVPGAVAAPAQMMAMAPTLHLQSSGGATAGAVTLGAGASRAVMQRPAAAPAGVASFAAVGLAIGAAKTVYLALDNVSTNTPPDVVYDVYLDLPDGTPPSPDGPYYAGTINFFAASHPHADHGAEPLKRSFTLDVTQVVRDLATVGKLTDTPSVTFVPVGAPNPAAKPVVGGIRIVEQ